jgi:hypothetical protein
VIKSYTLSDEQKLKVEKEFAESKKEYELVYHIVMESEIDAGPFFEHELEGDCDD